MCAMNGEQWTVNSNVSLASITWYPSMHMYLSLYTLCVLYIYYYYYYCTSRFFLQSPHQERVCFISLFDETTWIAILLYWVKMDGMFPSINSVKSKYIQWPVDCERNGYIFTCSIKFLVREGILFTDSKDKTMNYYSKLYIVLISF